MLELGGLYVVGTARHESRRVDNQLRGRAGRQGDPGATRFFLSLDDDIFRYVIYVIYVIDAICYLGLRLYYVYCTAQTAADCCVG